MTGGGWRSNRPLLICYAPVADPECPEDVLAIYAEQGVDVVEVGVPTANPYLDGPTVADSMRRVMRGGAAPARICANIDAHAQLLADRLRVVLMGYRDMPFPAFTALARKNLVQGLITADTGVNGDPIEMTDWLIREGVRKGLDPGNANKLRQLRQAKIDLPIALGFGIGTPEQAAQAIAMGADGVVIGSACIEAALQGARQLRAFIGNLRRAIDGQPLHAASG
jgi:tryptophan synthase alpha chain